MVAVWPGWMSPLSLSNEGNERLCACEPEFVTCTTTGPAGTSGMAGVILRSASVTSSC
jgi:hypothetical protein